MLTMSQINDIRDLSQKGYSISKISSLTGLDRKTVRKYLNQDDFSPQPPVAKRRTSIVTPYLDIIEEWLKEDQKHWSKQRHTAKRIHERLQTEYGFMILSKSLLKRFAQIYNPKVLRNLYGNPDVHRLILEKLILMKIPLVYDENILCFRFPIVMTVTVSYSVVKLLNVSVRGLWISLITSVVFRLY